MNADLRKQFERVGRVLRARGQDHVLRWWGELDPTARRALLSDIESIAWDSVDPLISTHVLRKPPIADTRDLAPPPVYPTKPPPDQEAYYQSALETGRNLLRSGKVAAMTVAGGQGTRLGVDGPKGAVIVTPTGDRTLFELFAQTIHAARRRYDAPIPWYVMTSPENRDQTVAFFESRAHFGLPGRDVVFFTQGVLPAFDFQGRLILTAKDRVALAPDGHGGSLKALVSNGCLKDMRERGIEVISYFQVDNPLVKPFDPLFIGLHVLSGSEMSTKVAAKADDRERVGNLCLREGKLTVVEYSEFPDELARQRTPDGGRRFNWGNLAIHLIDTAFVDRIVGRTFQLPIRRAEKKIAYLDETGRLCKPATPNAVKLESFVFDALPLARHPILLEVDRSEEFSPVKNATGADSLESAKRDQIARACRWLESAGVCVPRRGDGSPDVTVAISPLFALDANDLKAKLDRIPRLQPGDKCYVA